MYEICVSFLQDIFPIIPVFIALILVFNISSDILFRN